MGRAGGSGKKQKNLAMKNGFLINGGEEKNMRRCTTEGGGVKMYKKTDLDSKLTNLCSKGGKKRVRKKVL